MLKKLLFPVVVASSTSLEDEDLHLIQTRIIATHLTNAPLEYLKCPAQVGLNCPFNDLSKTTASSAGECCDKCHANSQCGGYVFNTKGECWLKYACQEPRTGASDVLSAGPIYRNGNSSGGWCPATNRMNCPFNDLPGQPSNPGSAGACCDACHANSACNGFIYNNKGQCWLKNACQNPVTGAGDVLAGGPIKRVNAKGLSCPSIKGMNCPFNDLRKDSASSADECCDKCHAASGCGGFVYNTKGECWLKNLRGCDNPTWRADDVIASGPIDRAPAGWVKPSPPPPPTTPAPTPPGGCAGGAPKCAGVACVDGAWVCNWHTTPPPSGGCSGATPKCGGVACVDGVWTCGASLEPNPSVCPGTDSPGEDTEVTDADCLDADKGFGPGFTCEDTDMWCSDDSGDGMTVGECCPTKCKKEFETKKKENRAENKKKNEAERKTKRKDNEASRKKAEKGRKKARKDKEWNNKRDDQESKNKNTETERKKKRGFKENKRKNEQQWKKNKEARRKAANKRQEKRNKNSSPAPSPKPRKPSKKCKKKKKKWDRCAKKKKCEKGQKKKGKSPPSC